MQIQFVELHLEININWRYNLSIRMLSRYIKANSVVMFFLIYCNIELE